ncbi:GDSL-type esterase/lipase family protein [Bacillus sp. AFS055030]|uniref:GDSL-type esterase/lipase family protein n=1 Tax=Bacillus sp. AFS055030 TaxID=2033507 RepID=UPI00257049A4|nr:GDSL-type esterase/lipase family protein [Bacillus sp. AFS055030]
MIRRKIVSTVLTFSLACFLVSTTTLAKEADNVNTYEKTKTDLVSLGDSITFGFNLGNTNKIPSDYAFPFLIGENANLEVRDLGVPGWTSDHLLQAIKNDFNFRQSVKHADYITLDIGNNDLLHILKKSNNIEQLPGKIATMMPKLAGNLNEIIQEIRELSDAPIVVYNFYNPFQVNNQPMHNLSNQLLSFVINPTIASIASKYKNVKIADAFSAFDEKQETYIIQGDIHPTIDGQTVLADIGKKKLGIK